MAYRPVIKAAICKESRRMPLNRTSLLLFPSQQKFQTSESSLGCWHRIITNVRHFCSGTQNRSREENLLSSPSVINKNMQESPQQIDMTISGASNTEMKVGETTNAAYGSTAINGSTGEWLTLDRKVNTYPSVRRFTAIGLGGDDFVKSMVVAVESVIQHSIPRDYVTQRVSSGRKYVSVNIGPVRVVSNEQVRAVYSAMRSDDRMKFFL